MSSIYYLMGLGISTPSLQALFSAGGATGLSMLDDASLLNEIVKDEALALLRNDPQEMGFQSGLLGGRGTSGKEFSVRVGPEYLSAAEAFWGDPCPRTLYGDWAAYQSLLSHIDRIGESL